MSTASLTGLTDPAEVAARLQAAGYSISGAEPTYVRHKPGETTIVAYRLTTLDSQATWAYAHWCDDPARADQIHHKATTLRPRGSPAGPGLSRLDVNTVFYAFPNDARLRRIRWYTDPRKIKRSLASLVGPMERISGSRTGVEVLRYKPERRAVIRVDLATPRQTQRLLVRYSTRRHAHHLNRVATHLRACGIDTPVSLARLDRDHVTVDEFIDGVEIRHAVRAGSSDPAALAAAIGRLHTTTAPPHTPHRTAAADLARALDGLTGLATWHPILAEPAQATAVMLQRALPTATAEPVLLHGDLHAKNLLVDHDRIAFIDLERVAIGPPAIDIGFFNSHAIALGIRQPGWSPRATDHARSVTDHYRSLNGSLSRAELNWHTALGLVEQALLVTRHLEGDWRRTSIRLLESARRLLAPDRAAFGAIR